MTTATLALALSLGLLGGTGDGAPPAAAASPDPYEPPPGTPADRALWRAAREINNDVVSEQYVAVRLQRQAKAGRYLERLADPASRGALAPERADELARRLRQRWMANVDLMASQWPVGKTRACQYDLLNLEGVMHADASSQKDLQLEDARRALDDCVGRARSAVRAARRASEELREALAEADRALPPLPAAPPAAVAGSAAPAAPAGSAAPATPATPR